MSSRSDHCPILLKAEMATREKGFKRCFRYEIMWERMESLSEVIKQTWDEELLTHNLLDLSSKLKSMMSSLRQWSKEHFGSVTKELEQAKTELEQLLMQDPVGNQVAIKHIQYKMDELLYREEMMWLQRSRISWLREGDRNTNFFHQKAAWRAKKNKIRRRQKIIDILRIKKRWRKWRQLSSKISILEMKRYAQNHSLI